MCYTDNQYIEYRYNEYLNKGEYYGKGTVADIN